ncbi:hypothetical protein MTO96_003428 [Rhipicephalus appendiculatus]
MEKPAATPLSVSVALRQRLCWCVARTPSRLHVGRRPGGPRLRRGSGGRAAAPSVTAREGGKGSTGRAPGSAGARAAVGQLGPGSRSRWRQPWAAARRRSRHRLLLVRRASEQLLPRNGGQQGASVTPRGCRPAGRRQGQRLGGEQQLSTSSIARLPDSLTRPALSAA